MGHLRVAIEQFAFALLREGVRTDEAVVVVRPEPWGNLRKAIERETAGLTLQDPSMPRRPGGPYFQYCGVIFEMDMRPPDPPAKVPRTPPAYRRELPHAGFRRRADEDWRK